MKVTTSYQKKSLIFYVSTFHTLSLIYVISIEVVSIDFLSLKTNP